MQDNVRPLRVADSEKLTINLGYVDLGRIDLLVQEGFYSNRSDFIRAAIRASSPTHAAEVARTVERHMLELGLQEFSRRRPRGRAGGGGDAAREGGRAGADRGGGDAGAGAGDDRVADRARGAAGEPGGQGGAGGPDRLRRGGAGKEWT